METVIRTHKIRLKSPGNKKESLLNQAYGTRRFAYNQAKALSDKSYELTGKTLGKLALRNLFVQEVKKNPDNYWLYNFPKSILEEAVFDYHQSLSTFFKRGHGMPTFAKKDDTKGSFSLNNEQFSVNHRTLRISKLGTFGLTEELRFQGHVLSATVSRKGKHHYVAITVRTPHNPLPHTGNVVGVDLNIHSIDDSDGNSWEHFQHLKRDFRRLKRAQQSLSRKQKGSNNRKKARRKVAKIHEQITNRRNDAHHKLSHTIVKDNSLIGVEDLNVSGMLKNRRLARAISDASFYSFLEKIKYKSDINDRRLIKVGRFFPSSKLCSQCGAKKTNLTLSDRTYVCDNEECKAVLPRDHNAAINIREEALRLSSLDSSTGGLPGSQASGQDVRPVVDSLPQADLSEAGTNHQS